MSKWHLFYNILGINDDSATPKAKELLGITSYSYSKLDVIKAFENTQKKLRRNIHDQKQLRSLIEFEKQILTPAMNELLENAALQSEILADDANDEVLPEEQDSGDDEIILEPVEEESEQNEDLSGDDYNKAIGLLNKIETPNRNRHLRYVMMFAAIVALFVVSILAVLLYKTVNKFANRFPTNISELIDPSSDLFQQDDDTETNDVVHEEDTKNISYNIANQKETSTKPGVIRNSEAMFSKLWKSGTATTDSTLNKTASALISCCDRIAKIDNRNKAFRKQLKFIGLNRKLESGSINISLTKLSVSKVKSFNQNQISTLKNMLNKGSLEDKKLAIARLSRIGNKQALNVLLNRLRRGYHGNDSRAIISRLIFSLCEWDDNNARVELANFIGKCPSARLASEISLKLMISTGITVDGDGRIPLKNSESQRNACSTWWQRRLQNYHAKARGEINPADPNSVRDPYDKDIDNLSGIAINATFIDMLANQLEVFSWESHSKEKYKFVGCSNIKVSQISDKLSSSSARVALEFLRIAREYNPSKQDSIELDIINLERRARILASSCAVQEAVANMHSAAQTLIVLNRQFDVNAIYKRALEEFKLEMKRDSKIATTSLEQLQQECYYCLRMLDLLRQQTRGRKYKRD